MLEWKASRSLRACPWFGGCAFPGVQGRQVERTAAVNGMRAFRQGTRQPPPESRTPRCGRLVGGSVTAPPVEPTRAASALSSWLHVVIALQLRPRPTSSAAATLEEQQRRSVDAKQSESVAAVPQIGARLCRHARATYRALGPWIQDDAATGEARRSRSRHAPRYGGRALLCFSAEVRAPCCLAADLGKVAFRTALRARARNNWRECLGEDHRARRRPSPPGFKLPRGLFEAVYECHHT